MKKHTGFNRWVWMILGAPIGAWAGYAFGVEHDYSTFIVVLTSIGGTIAGAAVLTVIMGLHYVFYRMDAFSGKQ